MQQDESVFIFKLGYLVGALLNLLGLGFVDFPYLFQIHDFSSWAITMAIKLFELSLAGLVTGFCGIAGKRYFERRFPKKVAKPGEETD